MANEERDADRLGPILERFHIRARLFYQGPLCGVTTFAAHPGRGFLHVLRQGEMAVTHRDEAGALHRIEVTEPSMLVYPRPLEHAFHNAPTEDSDFACATLEVPEGHDHPLLRALPPVIVLPLTSVNRLQPALDLLFAEVDEGLSGDRLLIDRLFDVVLIQFFRWVVDHSSELQLPAGLIAGLSDPDLSRAVTAIHAHPSRPWTLEALAREARMARSTFAERFAAVVGQPPADYVAEWRMLVAQELLLRGDSVGQVAQNVGYGTTPAFSRAFTRRIGVSPRDWAASHVS
ncbi:helix-turn-helix transcriptional regulator [Gulosibacter molinativorax]|uniref:AraC family transcriptional regulator n=1 Tax=Gulosibacter molinativorax TaxID=256821 RepID=A0ABT7C761_9MICO|nr:AraC family transcriptional regulator [Gulosibacter molinativorax]MDJ1371028.1 AraC family transcriptional regulator [Gulosibacter molinativorax]